jgi:hypothetical protein
LTVRAGAVFAAALLCALIAPAPTRADAPPYLTTDTEAADKLEVTSFLRSSVEGRVGGDELGFDIAIPLAPRWEMTIVPRFAEVRAGGAPSMGVGDTELAVKYLALVETATLPAIAFEPNVTLPTGGRRLGDGWVAIELPILVSKTLGPWRLSGQFGYERDGVHAGRDHAPMSLLLERAVSKRLSLGVEIADDLPMRRLGHGVLEANLGGSWAVRDGLQFQVAIGRRLASQFSPADLHSCIALAVEF